MADSPFTSKASEKRTSLAEMAARAAQRTSRPPPSPSVPPSSRYAAPARHAGSYAPPSPSYAPSSYAPQNDPDGSGLINLSHLSQVPTLAPQVRAIDPRMATPATPLAVQVPASAQGNGSRMVLAGVVVALVGIGIAFGLTSRNGSDAPSSAVHANAAMAPVAVAPAVVAPAVVAPAVVAPSQPVAVAPVQPAAAAPAAPAEKVNTPPGAIAPAEATEITRNATHATRVGKKGKKGVAAAAVAAAAPASPAPAAGGPPVPGAGAAAIAAAMAAEGVAPAAPPPAAAAEPAAAPPAPAAKAAPVAKAAPAPEPEPTGLLGSIKKAAGPMEANSGPEKAEAKAPPPRGDIPELPAQGAISGALGSPRAAARNCLTGQEAPSRATIVFASSGTVKSVNVTGPAAGTPAAECIKTAMSKTVVGPFKHETFSVSTTISPP
jgi:hypothetical protein